MIHYRRFLFNRSFIFLILFVGFFWLFQTPSAQGLEVYSFLTQNCQLTEGLIIDANETDLDILTLNGKYKKINREDLRHLAIYNTIDNPIRNLHFQQDPALKDKLIEVYVGQDPSPLFIGWPVKFVDNLVLFFDIKGKSHVFELYKIRKIRPHKKSLPPPSIQLNSQSVSLSYKSWITQCALPDNKGSERDHVRPTRMLGDQIQISEFLIQIEKGFENVKSFQERTYVYARPFLFDRSTRLGVLAFSKNNYVLSPTAQLPSYFQWTKGREFRFQSFNQVGGVPVEYLPTVEPLTVFRSDLKSHIFHAVFVGNLEALSAGTEYFTPIATGDHTEQRVYDPSSQRFKIHSAASLNYMAMMGADWGPWSLSVGTYFPTFMLQTKTEFREVLASKLAPIVRLMYTGDQFRLRSVFGSTKIKQDSNVRDNQISRDQDLSVIDYLHQFSFSSYFLRAGLDYQLNPVLQVTFDQLWLQANYEENLINSTKNRFSFSHLVSQFSARHNFGDYVALRIYLQMFKVDETAQFGSDHTQDHSDHQTYGGTFEFIF